MKNFSQTNFKSNFLKFSKPKVGLITLSTDFTIEKDFRIVCSHCDINIYVNRIPFNNPLNHENYIKMMKYLPEVANNILPGEKIDSIAYGCTSGTVAIGDQSVIDNIHKTKPNSYVSTPITAAIKSFIKLGIKKVSVLTPYPKDVNITIFDYLIKNEIEVTNFSSFNLEYDSQIAKVDPMHILETIKKIDYQESDAIFVSCTALPILQILDQVEKETSKTIISSNQALIWDIIRSVNISENIYGFGKLFLN